MGPFRKPSKRPGRRDVIESCAPVTSEHRVVHEIEERRVLEASPGSGKILLGDATTVSM